MFTVFEEERETDDCGNIRISLSQDTKNMIKEHFPNADSVVIIDNPQKFIEDVKNSIGHVIKGDLVHYYIDEGIQKENGNIVKSIGVRPHKAVPDIKRALPWSKELPEQCRMK